MLSVSDFVNKYKEYSDVELYEVHRNIDGYSAEAHEAMEIVLEQKGGMDQLLERLLQKQIIEKEIQRIANETAQLGKMGIDASFIKNTASSKILSAEKVNEIIDNKYGQVEQELDDKKIKPRTIAGSIFGGLVASVIGGILWGLQLIYSQRIFYILAAGLALFCYAVIKAATKQSKNNSVVLIATIVSIIAAILIGQILYGIIGYKE